jgi:hypothetical protein
MSNLYWFGITSPVDHFDLFKRCPKVDVIDMGCSNLLHHVADKCKQNTLLQILFKETH